MPRLLVFLMLFSYLPTVMPAENTYGPIRSGEMLWNIASRVRPDPTISRYQIIIALLKANPPAFSIPCNFNSLKLGQVLKIPSVAEMKVLSVAQASNEYHRQNNEWKTYRKQRQPIVCSPLESSPQPAEPILSLIKSTMAPAVVPVAKVEVTKNPSQTFRASGEENLLSLLLTPSPTLLILIVTMIVFLFLSFSIGWLLHKRAVREILVKQNHSERNFKSDLFPTGSKSDEIKEKLAYMRTYLAEGEQRAVERLLREVMEKGTSEQQEEAKQLVEINKKMSTLELYIAKNSAANPLLQEIVQVTQHVPNLQYLTENKSKTLELVDKIFKFLDHELNAQGKLLEAYTNRYKPEFFEAKEYTVLKKNEKVIEELENPSPEPRAAPKPTRYL